MDGAGQQEALVCSASADKTARVWSAERERELAIFVVRCRCTRTVAARFHARVQPSLRGTERVLSGGTRGTRGQ